MRVETHDKTATVPTCVSAGCGTRFMGRCPLTAAEKREWRHPSPHADAGQRDVALRMWVPGYKMSSLSAAGCATHRNEKMCHHLFFFLACFICLAFCFRSLLPHDVSASASSPAIWVARYIPSAGPKSCVCVCVCVCGCVGVCLCVGGCVRARLSLSLSLSLFLSLLALLACLPFTALLLPLPFVLFRVCFFLPVVSCAPRSHSTGVYQHEQQCPCCCAPHYDYVAVLWSVKQNDRLCMCMCVLLLLVLLLLLNLNVRCCCAGSLLPQKTCSLSARAQCVRPLSFNRMGRLTMLHHALATRQHVFPFCCYNIVLFRAQHVKITHARTRTRTRTRTRQLTPTFCAQNSAVGPWWCTAADDPRAAVHV